jgi:ABC-type proline/glycine betaine transport system permease subunit
MYCYVHGHARAEELSVNQELMEADAAAAGAARIEKLIHVALPMGNAELSRWFARTTFIRVARAYAAPTR